MKNLISTTVVLIVGMAIGAILSFYVSRSVYSRSQAMSIMNESGIVITDSGVLTYFVNEPSLSPQLLEAVYTIGQDYTSITVEFTDLEEQITPPLEFEEMDVDSSLIPVQ